MVSGSSDRTVRRWDAATGTPLGDPMVGHTGPARSVAVGQLEGRTIVVSGSRDQTMRRWDAATGTPLGDPMVGHTGPVRSVAVGQLEGRTIVVSGSRDQTMRMWDAATATPLGGLPWQGGKAEDLPSKIELAAAVLGIVFAASSRIVTATDLGLVSLRMPMS